MKINAQCIYTLNSQKANALYQAAPSKASFTKSAESPALFRPESPAVKLIISKEGKLNYRNSLLESGKGSNNVLPDKEELLSGKFKSQIDYSFALGNRFSFIGGDQTTEERASDLLNAYMGLYDEIMKNCDPSQQENEINALNSAYKKYADTLETFANRADRDAKMLEDIAESLARFSGRQTPRVKETEDTDLSLKAAAIPSNLSQLLMEAARKFVQQYKSAQQFPFMQQFPVGK